MRAREKEDQDVIEALQFVVARVRATVTVEPPAARQKEREIFRQASAELLRLSPPAAR